jgi:flagellar P-ring protein precursor FlgI
MRKLFTFASFVGCLIGVLAAAPARAEKIGDVVRVKGEQPNELVGMGLVVGLKGTGDGGSFSPAMRPLKEMMKKFDNPVQVEAELKNANNVAIVTLSAKLPQHGANEGDKVDVRVSSLAAKSLKGGHLFIVPLVAPTPGSKLVLGFASGEVMLDDENVPTQGIIRNGGVMIQDVLPDEIKGDAVTLVLRTETQGVERANAIAETINAELSQQTDGRAMAIAPDATSVTVMIPRPERANPTAFLARILGLPLPDDINDPAKVYINKQSKTIIFTGGVEIAPTSISQGGISITVGKQGEKAKLKDLQDALELMKVSAEDRIAIVEMLARKNVLKAALETE